MALYLVSWDIPEKSKDEYKELYALLKKFKETRILESVSVIDDTADQALELAARLRDTLKTGDRLLVIEVTDDAGIHNLLVSDKQFQAVLQDARAGIPRQAQ